MRKASGTALPRLASMLLALLVTGCAQSWADELETANALYDQGKFSEAKQQYEKLAAAGQGSANLFYNLGNAAYRLGAPGAAILNYERALALDPAHPEAQANLALARGQTGAKRRTAAWWEAFFIGRSVRVWSVTGVVAAWTFLFALAFALTARRTVPGGVWLIASAGFFLAAYAGACLWRLERERETAIVTAKSAEARLAPADSAGLAETLPAGSRVRVLSERGDWVYCALPGEGRGWVAARAVERVQPPAS